MNDNFIAETMQFMTEHYGVNIKHRHAKLREEEMELDDALKRYEEGKATVDEVLAEAADVMAVLLHIIWIVMNLPCSMFAAVVAMMLTRARMKMERRLYDKDYDRSHPHKANLEGGEK